MIYNDLPIDDASQDRFGRANFAEKISNVIDNWSDEDGYTFGIYGGWGEGKSSVLNMIAANLDSSEHNIVIRFNPWRFSSESDLLLAFFNTLSRALDEKINTKSESLGKLIKDYAEIVLPKLSFFGVSVDMGKSMKELGARMSETGISDIKKRVARILVEHSKTVVIIIDDIDRLDKAEMQSIFKLVRLTGDFKKTIYLLAFDDKIVSSALAEVYGKGEGNSGYEYLEKIIQVPLRLPQIPRKSVVRYSLEALEKLLNEQQIGIHKDDRKWYRQFFEKHHLPFIQNPRLVLRFVNTLRFSLVLLDGDEICYIDLLVIEGVKTFYPELYEWVRLNPDFLIGYNGYVTENKGIVEKEIDNCLSIYSIKSVINAKNIIADLFPECFDLREYKSNKDNPMYTLSDSFKEHSYKAKRIYSPFFFHRYFTFSIDVDEVPQAIISIIIHLVNSGANPEYYVNQAIEDYGVSALVKRLNDEYLDTRNEDGILSLIVALNNHDSDYYEKDNSFFAQGDNLFKQYVDIVFKLFSKLPCKKKESLLIRLIDSKVEYHLINNIISSFLFEKYLADRYSKDIDIADYNIIEDRQLHNSYNYLLDDISKSSKYKEYYVKNKESTFKVILNLIKYNHIESVNFKRHIEDAYTNNKKTLNYFVNIFIGSYGIRYLSKETKASLRKASFYRFLVGRIHEIDFEIKYREVIIKNAIDLLEEE